ncbi:hypothetical protein BH10ACT6_BH10ACT6_13160 [soil metagenome]
MARADLSSLLGKLGPELPPTRPTTAEPSAPEMAPAVSGTPVAARRRSVSKPPLDEAVGYLRFVRKDTRLREDQLEALTVQARRLNRAKRNTGVRITENTLIRIAVDLLLSRMEQASGDDEATLRESLR